MGQDAVILRGQKQILCYERFYGPGYERGNWPLIRALIVQSEATHYGSDTYYLPVPITPELLALLDAHWQQWGKRPWDEEFDAPARGDWPEEWDVGETG